MPIQQEKDQIRVELLMDAGFGAQTIGNILVRSFVKSGKYVFIETLIPSEISPPKRTKQALSGIILRVAGFELTNIGDNTDIIIAAHEIVLGRRLEDHTDNGNKCLVLLDTYDKNIDTDSYSSVLDRVKNLGFESYQFGLTRESREKIKLLGGKGKNFFYGGMISAICNIPPDIVIKEIEIYFVDKISQDIVKINTDLFTAGYEYVLNESPCSYYIKNNLREYSNKMLIDGNSAISMGIIDAGIKLCTGYPITPATSILHVLAKELPFYGGIVHQAEDEISAIGTAIGSYLAGVPAVTCTSGPGLSLKQEFIGYASAAEVPVIIIDVQRGGPSTGMPTRTEQSDLLSIIYGSHGDNTKVVISVSDIRDCFYAPHLARYLTEKLRLPVFIVSDFQMTSSYSVIDDLQVCQMESVDDIDDIVFEHFGIDRLPDKIEMVCTNQSVPGGDIFRRVTGLNTDENGAVSYSPKDSQRAHQVRNEKLHIVSRALHEPEIFGAKASDLLIVGWGSSRGALREAIENCTNLGMKVSGLHFKIVCPLPINLSDIFSRFKNIATVEVAYGDKIKPAPLASLLRTYSGRAIESAISKASGMPIRPKEIETWIKEYINGKSQT